MHLLSCVVVNLRKVQKMKDLNDVDVSSNVIKVEFCANNRSEIPTHISHPASRHYPPEDNAKELLKEFDELINSHSFRDDYIFHHDKKWDYKAEFSDGLNSIVDKISSQISRIKEDTKRIKFYLDDL